MQVASKKEPTAERDTRIFSARVPRDLVKQLRRYALDNDLKVQQVVADAFREYLARRKA